MLAVAAHGGDHRDMRYCSDYGRVTVIAPVGVMCTECEHLLAKPFVAIEFAAAAAARCPPTRKKRHKAAEGAAPVPKVGVDLELRLGLGPGTDRAPQVQGFDATLDMADRPGLVPVANRASQVEGFDAISDMADRLGLKATVRDRAKEVFKKMEDAKAWPHGRGSGWIRDRSRGTLCAACLSIACRNEGSPRALKQLASVTADGAAALKEIAKLTAHISKRLGEDAGQGTGVGVVHVSSYVLRFGPLLGIGAQEAAAAQEAARRMDEGAVDVRHKPESVAATVVYMATQRAGGKKGARNVSMATGLSEVTIKMAYKALGPHAELLFD